MPKNIARIITILLASACLSIGCASSVDNPENENENGNENQNQNQNQNQGQNGNGNGQLEPEYCTGDECKEEEEFLKTGNCPQAGYSTCDNNDPKIRRFCDNDPESETFDKIITEECDDICLNDKCVKFSGNSCDNPYVVPLGGSVSGSTISGSTYSSDQTSCSGRIKPMKAVFKVEIPKMGFYKFTMSNSEGQHWGNILTPACELKDEITSVCDQDNSTDTLSALLTAGDYYLFVAPATTFAVDFDATVAVREVSYDEAKLCGSDLGSFTLVEFDSNGEYKTSGDTANGVSKKNYSDFGCARPGNGGKEIAYMLSARKGQKIKATLQLKSEENLPDAIGLYIQHCNDNVPTTKRCAETKATDGLVTLSWDVGITGEYLLYVDSNASGTKTEFQYDLTITVE